MGNGNCVLTIGGIDYPLYFGRLAVEEFAKRTEQDLTPNGFKIATDMVYAGIINFQNRNNLPTSPYSEVYDLMELFTDDPDWEEKFRKVDETFFDSKYGSQYKQKIEELKKKLEEEMVKTKEELTKKTQQTKKKNTG